MSAPSEAAKFILDLAKTRAEPFTTADVFEGIDLIEEKKEASDALRFLFLKGKVARMQIAGGKFLYDLRERAAEGYETFADCEMHNEGQNDVNEPEKQSQNIAMKCTTLKPKKPKQIPENPKPATETVKLPEGFCLTL